MLTNVQTAEKVANLLLGYGVVKLSPEAPFTWASGLKSPIYCNNRELLSIADDVDRYEIVRGIVETFECNFDIDDFDPRFSLVGVATGAIPWGAMAAYLGEYPYGYVIAAPKDHGADSNQPTPEEEQQKLAKCLIGKFDEQSRIVIIEDLISTGGSSMHAVKAVRAAGYDVAGMVALFSYGFEEASKAFDDADCSVVVLCDYNTLIRVAVEEGYITEEQQATLKEWRMDHRAWSKAHGGK